MSATNRSEHRAIRPQDFYETPAHVTRAIKAKLVTPPTGILDPCAGMGAILREFKDWYAIPRYGIEIDSEKAKYCCEYDLGAVRTGDCLGISWVPADLTITNPPYSLALPILEKALALRRIDGKGTVAFLLRLPFLCSLKRQEFFKSNPCKLYILSRRPSFTGGGTDATEYAWFVWGDGHEPNTWELI